MTTLDGVPSDGYREDLLDKLVAAHPDLTSLGVAGFALAPEATRILPEETPCPVCGVMLTEEHIPDE